MLSAGGQGNKLFPFAARAEVLPDFIEGPAEREGVTEELPGGVHVPGGAQKGANQTGLPIRGAIRIHFTGKAKGNHK